MAGGEVGLGLGRGALGAHSIAHALVCALRLLPALLIAALVGTFARAARTLAGTGGVVGVRGSGRAMVNQLGRFDLFFFLTLG